MKINNALGQQTRMSLRAEPASDLVHLAIDSEPVIAAICNAPAPGGQLKSQLLSLKKTAADAGRKPIAVRSAEFAKSPTAQVNLTLGELIAAGGRPVIFPEADWRAVQAWRAFGDRHAQEDGFNMWAQANRPLTQVPGLCKLVGLENLLLTAGDELEDQPVTPIGNGHGDGANGRKATEPPEPPPVTPSEPTADLASELDPTRIIIGKSLAFRPEPVSINIASLNQHLAVLGGNGSGKTTLALALIEHLLLRGVPAILVDRKGDLARYADPTSLAKMSDPLVELFRKRVDVALYTPGNEDGRPLSISVLPTRNPGASTQEIRTQAEDAAQALCAMLGYGESRSHATRRAALISAIQVLLELDDAPPTVERLLHLMNTEDPALLQAMGYLDRKVLRELVSALYSFCRINARVLGADAEPLDAERLLGLGTFGIQGRTRLTVVSTKFLGDDQVVQFWIAQLMMELARFASARPSRELQAVVMLDEADLYLPAVGKPACKQPIENALRRFRSQGIGLILATQSPGDFDYRCRENIQTWLVGRVKETRALEKLRPVFGQDGASHLERLSQHATGDFCLVRADTLTRFQAERNLLTTEQMGDSEIVKVAHSLCKQ